MLTAKPFSPDVVLAPSAENHASNRPLAAPPREAMDGSFAAVMKRALTHDGPDSPADVVPRSPKKQEKTIEQASQKGPLVSAVQANPAVVEIDLATGSGVARPEKDGESSESSETEEKVRTLPTIVTAKGSKPITVPLEDVVEPPPASDSEHDAPRPAADLLAAVPLVVLSPAPLVPVIRVVTPPPITSAKTVTQSASETVATTSSTGAEALPTIPSCVPATAAKPPSAGPERAEGGLSPGKEPPKSAAPIAVPLAPATSSVPLAPAAPSAPADRAKVELTHTAEATSISSASLSASIDPDGIATAKNSTRMKKVEEIHQASRKPNTTLPRAATLSSDSADNARPAQSDAPTAPPLNRETAAAGDAIHPDLSATGPLRRLERSQPAPEPIRLESAAAVSAVEHEILTRVAELKRLRPDSMSMLLRPDAQTEVHLHLQLQDGVVEIEVKLQRGDGGVLGAQWGQLQQNLSGQGIRLSALSEASTADSSGRHGTGSFSEQQSAPRRQPQEESPAAERPLRPMASPASTVVAKAKRPAPPNRSSEWWA